MWSNMNILVIPTNDWMRAPGRGHINSIAEELAARGHNVYAWNFDFYRNEAVKRTPRNVKLFTPRTLPIRDPALFFSLNALFQGPAVFKTMRDLKIDVVINENVLSGLVAFLASNSNVLRVFDFSDYFPESASIYYTGSSQAMKKMVEVFTLAITKLNIRFSQICLAVCRSLINAISTMNENKPCYMITNGAYTNKCTGLNTENKKNPQEIMNPSGVIIIMGVIDDWLDLETPIEALKILGNRFQQLRLVIIGPWQKKEYKTKVEEFIKGRGLESRVEITGYISDEKLAEYLRVACCSVIPYKTDSYFSVIRLPEKLFVYSAYGKPVLSTPLPEVLALRCEHVFIYHDSEEFARVLSAILDDKNLRVEIEAKAKKFAREHDFKVLAEQLEQILVDGLNKLRAKA